MIVVQLQVRNRVDNNYVYIEALWVPIVCSPLTRQSIKNLPVGILIGLDFYHSFFTGNVVKGKNGPAASESILGWILSGRVENSGTSPAAHCFEIYFYALSG